jgi:hypothetical protein
VSPSLVPRDQHESAFASILSELVDRVAGARAAVLVDSIGETVDYSGRADPFAMRVTAAHWRIVLDQARAQPSLGATQTLAVRAERKSYVVSALPEGYGLVLVLSRGSSVISYRRAIVACTHRLAKEAGWFSGHPDWSAVDVLTDPQGRPESLRVANGQRPLEILGAVVGGLGRGERSWRVRLDTGREATLVREPRGARGYWYTDELLG